MHSLPFGVLRGVEALVLSVVCFRELSVGPLDLSLVVRYDPTSCFLHATAFPSPVGLVSFLANPTVRVADLGVNIIMYKPLVISTEIQPLQWMSFIMCLMLTLHTKIVFSFAV